MHTPFLIEIVGSWLAAPFLCAAVTILAYEIVVKLESRFALTTVSLVNRVLLVIAVFYVSFTLGANNIGLIVSFARNNSLTGSNIILELSIFLTASLGMILFGKSIAKVVGDKIVVLSQIKTLSAMLGSAIVASLFTALSVPVSLTQVVIGGMLGARCCPQAFDSKYAGIVHLDSRLGDSHDCERWIGIRFGVFDAQLLISRRLVNYTSVDTLPSLAHGGFGRPACQSASLLEHLA